MSQQERNPFAVVIPIALFVAAAIVVFRWMGSQKRPNTDAVLPTRTARVICQAISAAHAGDNVSPDAVGVTKFHVTATASDAAILWLSWDDSNTNFEPDRIVNREGRKLNWTGQILGPHLYALILAKGYGPLSGALTLAAQIGGKEQVAQATLSIPSESLPSENHMFVTAGRPDPSVEVQNSEKGSSFFTLAFKPRSARTEAMAVRILRSTYNDRPNNSWAFLVPQNGRFLFEGYLPNASFSDAVELEVLELDAPGAVQYMEFKKIGLTASTAHRVETFEHPETVSGPFETTVALKAISGSPKPARPTTKLVGFLSLQFQTLQANPTHLAQDLICIGRFNAEVVYPLPESLGVAKSNFKVQIVPGWKPKPTLYQMLALAGKFAEPKLPKFTNGSVGLKVTVQQPVLISERDTIVPLTVTTRQMHAPID